MFSLRICYENGERVVKGVKKAIKSYEHAASLGNSMAMNNLAIYCENGDGVAKNKKAIELCERAVSLGDATAMFNLGNWSENGEGVMKDLKKAIELCASAAASGGPDAKSALARLRSQRF